MPLIKESETSLPDQSDRPNQLIRFSQSVTPEIHLVTLFLDISCVIASDLTHMSAFGCLISPSIYVPSRSLLRPDIHISNWKIKYSCPSLPSDFSCVVLMHYTPFGERNVPTYIGIGRSLNAHRWISLMCIYATKVYWNPLNKLMLESNKEHSYSCERSKFD